MKGCLHTYKDGMNLAHIWKFAMHTTPNQVCNIDTNKTILLVLAQLPSLCVVLLYTYVKTKYTQDPFRFRFDKNHDSPSTNHSTYTVQT